jgi:hypothetical protein
MQPWWLLEHCPNDPETPMCRADFHICRWTAGKKPAPHVLHDQARCYPQGRGDCLEGMT